MTTKLDLHRTESYELLATEYYDAAKHPTSANLRVASAVFLNDLLREYVPRYEHWCEVGCGQTILAPAVSKAQADLGSLILVDSSASMLAHSRGWFQQGARGLVCDAEHLPLAPRTVGLLVACLGDAYNTPRFWKEVRRVLAPRGTCLFTTPSFAWASTFRRNGPSDCAVFLSSNGRSICAPSLIRRESEQERVMTDAELVIIQRATVTMSALDGMAVSPQLLPERGPQAAVVTGWVAQADR